MLHAVTATTLSNFKTQRIGKGTFGAKTTELERFKAAFEAKGFLIPPPTSFPIDMFIPTLARIGYRNQHGKLSDKSEQFDGSPEEGTKNDHAEAREILQAAAQFVGHPIVIRSDEMTAKGIGAFETQIIGYSSEASAKEGHGDHKRDLLERILVVLRSQFKPTPMAFKQRTGMPHGIGVMIMPLIGDIVRKYGDTFVYPKVSLSGFTAMRQGKVMVNFGYGIGGGVDNCAGMIIADKTTKVLNTSGNCQESIDAFDLNKGRDIDIKGDNDELGIRKMIPDPLDTEHAAISVGIKMLEIAKELGVDFYWEAQSMDFEADVWAVTQVSEHIWPKVEKPSGRELLEINPDKPGIIVGSGVIPCKGMSGGEKVPCDWNDKDITELMAGVPENSLLIGPRILISDPRLKGSKINMGIDTFPLYCNAGAVVNTDAEEHGHPMLAHMAGIYREAGIPVLITNRVKELIEVVPISKLLRIASERGIPHNKFSQEFRNIRAELRRTTEFIVWADELNQCGGVVAP